MKDALKNEEEDSEGGSDSNPSGDELSLKERDALHKNIVSAIRDYNSTEPAANDRKKKRRKKTFEGEPLPEESAFERKKTSGATTRDRSETDPL